VALEGDGALERYGKKDEAQMVKSKLRISLSVFALAGAMTLGTGSALAQDSSVETYSGGGGDAVIPVEQGVDPADPATADPTGALPFSGLDIGLALGGGLLLLGTGMAISRLLVPADET
jgi:hypothetical protein